MKKAFLAVILCSVGSAMSWGAEKPSENSYFASAVKEIHIGIQRGKIKIVPSQGPVKLDILRLDNADKCDISTTTQDGELRVVAKTKGWLWGHGNVGDGIKIPHNEKSACAVSVTVQAPPDLTLSIAGSYADIVVGKWEGSAKFSIAYGKLRLNGVRKELKIDGVSNIVDGEAGSQDAHINSVRGYLHLTWSQSAFPNENVEISEVGSDNILEFPKKTDVEIEKSGWVEVSNQFAKDDKGNEPGNRNVEVHISGVGGTLGIVKLGKPGKGGNSKTQAESSIEKNAVLTASQSPSAPDAKKFAGSYIAIQSSSEDIMLGVEKPGEIRYQLKCVPERDGVFLFGDVGFWKTSQSTLEKERNKNRVDFDSQEGTLTIHSGKHWSCRAGIYIPKEIKLALKTMSGDVQILQRTGKTKVVSMSGDIKIQDAKSIQARSMSGNIKIENSSGPIQVKSTSGDIKITGGLKGVIAKDVSGDVSISGSGPQTWVKTRSGDIVLSPPALKSFPCIEAHVGSGDLKIAPPWKICDKSTVNLHAGSGDITVR